MNLTELQTLVDFVASTLGEKAKYKAVISSRLKRYSAVALIAKFLVSGRRTIKFSKSFINSYSSERITTTIIHEITHFKLAEKNRRILNRLKKGLFPYYPIKKEKWHSKRFYKRFEKLQTKFDNNFNQPINE
ncbi:MAG: SprT-like domain-containing protein [bacterium]